MGQIPYSHCLYFSSGLNLQLVSPPWSFVISTQDFSNPDHPCDGSHNHMMLRSSLIGRSHPSILYPFLGTVLLDLSADIPKDIPVLEDFGSSLIPSMEKPIKLTVQIIWAHMHVMVKWSVNRWAIVFQQTWQRGCSHCHYKCDDCIFWCVIWTVHPSTLFICTWDAPFLLMAVKKKIGRRVGPEMTRLKLSQKLGSEAFVISG